MQSFFALLKKWKLVRRVHGRSPIAKAVVESQSKQGRTEKWVFYCTEEQYAHLKRLQAECGCASLAELLNNALTFTQWSIEQAQADMALVSIDKERGGYTELVIPILTAARRRRARV